MKTLIAGLIAFAISFLMGWLIFGYILTEFFTNYSNHFNGLLKEPFVMWAMVVSNLTYGLLIAYVFDLAAVKTVAKGAMVAMVLSALLSLSFDMFTFSQMNLIGYRVMTANLIVNAAIGALIGAVLGWWMGRGSNA